MAFTRPFSRRQRGAERREVDPRATGALEGGFPRVTATQGGFLERWVMYGKESRTHSVWRSRRGPAGREPPRAKNEEPFMGPEVTGCSLQIASNVHLLGGKDSVVRAGKWV